jgi:hypothetical protein
MFAKADNSEGIDLPFTNSPLPSGATGEFTFSPGLTGIFVLSLKAAHNYTLFEFDAGHDTWASLYFTTNGVATNSHGNPQGLSHASLLLIQTSETAPEPATVILLLFGLAGVGIVAYRRRHELEA